MILSDDQARTGKKEARLGPRNEDLNIQLPRGTNNEEYEKRVKERRFAKYFWTPADRPSWPYWEEFSGVFLAFIIVAGLVAFLILLIELNTIGALIIGGSLAAALFVINLRGTFTRTLFGGRGNDEVVDLNLNDKFEYSFAKGRKDILFIRDERHLIGLALFRFKAVPIDPEGAMERFIRSILERQVPLYLHHQQVPLTPEEIIEKNSSVITEKVQKYFSKKEPHEQASEIEKHGGIWGVRNIFGSHRMVSASNDCEATRRILAEQLISDLKKIRSAFKQTFPRSILEPLLGKDLRMTCQCSIRFQVPVSFCVTGYEAVGQFWQLPQILTKNIPHDLPVEQVVPRTVPHDMTLGKAFDTEFQKNEVAVGFNSQDLLKGILVTSGTMEGRFQTNTKLVHAAAGQGMNYLVITNNPEWRCMLKIMPTACLLRLGEELIWNLLDPDGSESIEYALLLMQAFAQLFHLSANGCQWLLGGINNCLVENQREIADLGVLADRIGDLTSGANSGMTRELGVVYKFLNNIRLGKISTMLGATNIPLDNLVQGVNIVEIDVKNQKHLQFLTLCLLAKILAFSRNNLDQMFMVLVDMGDVLVPLDPLSQSARDTEQYLLEWVRRFRELSNIGLHLSMQSPSRFTKVVLSGFPNVLVHRTISYEDIRRIQDLLQFLPDNVVFSKGVRHENWARESLKRLPPNRLFMKHPNINNGFTVDITPLDLPTTRKCTPEEIIARLKNFFPDWSPVTPDKRSVLERNFPRNIKVVSDLLSLLFDYEKLSTRALLSSLNSSPEIDLDMPTLDHLLFRLVDYDYLVRVEWVDRRWHQHFSYKLTDKGATVYRDYVEVLRERLENRARDLQGNEEPEVVS